MKEVITENLNDISLYESFKERIYKICGILMIAYFPIYLGWFSLLARFVKPQYIVSGQLDAALPFLEIFVIPYYMWFGYVPAFMFYFYRKSRRDFIRTGFALVAGMTICLIIFTIWPNGVHVRPTVFARDNIFVHLVKFVYSVDTPTNCCPSIHCLNSILINIGVMKCERLKKKKKMRIFSNVLAVSICLSTVFIKQHAIVDVFAAIALSIPLYYVSYVMDWSRLFEKLFDRKKINYEE